MTRDFGQGGFGGGVAGLTALCLVLLAALTLGGCKASTTCEPGRACLSVCWVDGDEGDFYWYENAAGVAYYCDDLPCSDRDSDQAVAELCP